jgi:hypothetical protein
MAENMMGSNGQMGITMHGMMSGSRRHSLGFRAGASEKQSSRLVDSSLANSSVLNYRGEQWG